MSSDSLFVWQVSLDFIVSLLYGTKYTVMQM
jgi:hypothetical protein